MCIGRKKCTNWSCLFSVLKYASVFLTWQNQANYFKRAISGSTLIFKTMLDLFWADFFIYIGELLNILFKVLLYLLFLGFTFAFRWFGCVFCFGGFLFWLACLFFVLCDTLACFSNPTGINGITPCATSVQQDIYWNIRLLLTHFSVVRAMTLMFQSLLKPETEICSCLLVLLQL